MLTKMASSMWVDQVHAAVAVKVHDQVDVKVAETEIESGINGQTLRRPRPVGRDRCLVGGISLPVSRR